VVARELLLVGAQMPPSAVRLAGSLLGERWASAGTVGELCARLPASARWVLDGIDDPADLWQAEARWWLAVESDGMRLLRGSRLGPGPLTGVVAVLAADAWRVTAALEVAARGASPEAVEAFDALA
jgi:hypothetical protein